jgi:hypothetical protein
LSLPSLTNVAGRSSNWPATEVLRTQEESRRQMLQLWLSSSQNPGVLHNSSYVICRHREQWLAAPHFRETQDLFWWNILGIAEGKIEYAMRYLAKLYSTVTAQPFQSTIPPLSRARNLLPSTRLRSGLIRRRSYRTQACATESHIGGRAPERHSAYAKKESCRSP